MLFMVPMAVTQRAYRARSSEISTVTEMELMTKFLEEEEELCLCGKRGVCRCPKFYQLMEPAHLPKVEQYMYIVIKY